MARGPMSNCNKMFDFKNFSKLEFGVEIRLQWISFISLFKLKFKRYGFNGQN